MWIVYGLTDVEGDIRYVGFTSETAQTRRGRHLRDERDTYKTRWIKSMIASGAEPGVVALQSEIPTLEAARTAEIAWIAHGWSVGWRLTNTQPGGQGGYVSPEGRARLREMHQGIPKPQHVVENLRQHVEARRPGEPGYDAWYAAHLRGVEKRKANGTYGHGPEARAKVSAAAKGRVYTPEQRARMAEGKRASWARKKAAAEKAMYEATET